MDTVCVGERVNRLNLVGKCGHCVCVGERVNRLNLVDKCGHGVCGRKD